MMDASRVGATIRAERARRGLTQAELAEATGIAQTTLAGYERGKSGMSFENALTLAEFFGMGLDEFSGGAPAA